MADQEDEDLQVALRMSLHSSPPEPKRSKPQESSENSYEETPEAKNRRLRRELMAAAAEKRMMMFMSQDSETEEKSMPEGRERPGTLSPKAVISTEEWQDVIVGEKLKPGEAAQLFSMLFGADVSKDILAQWSNQGIRFSSDPETFMGLVQHEGGPCGVLAAIQAFVLKHLLFFPDEFNKNAPSLPDQSPCLEMPTESTCISMNDFSSLTDEKRTKALVLSMVEILFMCGSNKRAIIATVGCSEREAHGNCQNYESIEGALEGLHIESASDLHSLLIVNVHTLPMSAFDQLKVMLPIFRSRLGAMLFLISALLSRGLDLIQVDRDDPSLPLVTAPFGHASQEIVNLLLCGRAVPNVFDGQMDLGSGMSLKGIPTSVEVGFLSLIESYNFCKVGWHLKCPRWPIWVVGSESHYTVLFALEPTVQDENELEQRESLIRRSFDAQDQSGGGGFVSVEGLHHVLQETNINLPREKLDQLCSMGFIVWSEFWQVLLELDRGLGGMKDPTGLMGKKQFDLYHFNGIAKSVINGSPMAIGESPLQRPRLSKLRVTVPPKWTRDELVSEAGTSSVGGPAQTDLSKEGNQSDQLQHAPLVDCIRTRWGRAICSWVGDPPSIV